MLDCEGKPVREGDIVEYLDWCYATNSKWNAEKQETEYAPLYGVVVWNTEYFTYEPLIFSEDDYNGNCFANVCRKSSDTGYPDTYFKVIDNIYDNPKLQSQLLMTQGTDLVLPAPSVTPER